MSKDKSYLDISIFEISAREKKVITLSGSLYLLEAT